MAKVVFTRWVLTVTGAAADMSLKQVLVRTAVIGLMVLVGLTVPSFDKILNLLGSTTIGVLAFVMPPVFYLRLVTQRQDGWPER